MMKKIFLILFFSILFCSQIFAAGNIIDREADDKISVSNIIYSNKTEALLTKTGQETTYRPIALDDDGALELGIAHSFTVLTTGQYAGSTNVTINSLTHVTSNACVRNENTGDIWHREVIQADIGPAADGKLFWEQYTLAAETCTCDAGAKTITADSGTPFSATALCVGRIFTIRGSAAGNNATFTVTGITTSVITVSETVVDEASIALDFASVDDLIWDLKDQVNAQSLSGYSDWRIPNRKELESIVDLGQIAPAINTTIFPSTPSDKHWNSTMLASSNTPWFISFNDGYMYFFSGQTNNLYIRLVR